MLDTEKELNVLVTGGCGFIASYLIKNFIKNTKWNIIILDRLSYSTKGSKRLEDFSLLSNKRVKMYTWDLNSPLSEGMVKELGDVNAILHLAAISHVNYSIKYPVETIQNNIMSTVNLLEYARTLKSLFLFHYFSSDECLGPSKEYGFKENDPHNPKNPYSASKSSSELLCQAYENTYKIPLFISRVVNTIGFSQHVEKFIPLVIKNIYYENTTDIHCEQDGTIGSRFFMHASEVASAILFILKNGKIGEKYNITSENRIDNLTIALKISKIMGKELKYTLSNFQELRPGHDGHYFLCGLKLESLGWKSDPNNFDRLLTKTVHKYLENMEWLAE